MASNSGTARTPAAPAQAQPSTAQPDAQPTVDPARAKANLDLATTLQLHRWPALSTAVSSSWGGPDSGDKRDWFAAFLADHLWAAPAADHEDVEGMLLEFLEEEFDVRLEDESEREVAAELLGARAEILRGEEGGRLAALRAWWDGRRGKSEVVIAQGERAGADEDEWSDESDDEEGGVGVDVDMADAPPLVQAAQPARAKALPEVDEDGFTKVVGKKRR